MIWSYCFVHKTPALQYTCRYNTLPEEEKHEFGLEEDNLLSIILHNLLVFMLMVGMSQEETAMLIHRFAARIRLATSEEKLLQQTLKYIEQKVRGSFFSMIAI